MPRPDGSYENGEAAPAQYGPGYVWDDRFGTFIPRELAQLDYQGAQADARTRGENADQRYGLPGATNNPAAIPGGGGPYSNEPALAGLRPQTLANVAALPPTPSATPGPRPNGAGFIPSVTSTGPNINTLQSNAIDSAPVTPGTMNSPDGRPTIAPAGGGSVTLTPSPGMNPEQGMVNVNQGPGTGGAASAGSASLTGHRFRVRMPDGTEKEFTGITPDLDAALKAGGAPLDPVSGQPMKLTNWNGGYLADGLPLNVIFGDGWQPGQLNSLLDQQFDGTLLAGYDKKFSWDPSTIKDDPAYQFQLQQGEQGVQRGAAANLSLLSGKTLKDLERFRTGLVSNFETDSYNRAAQDYERDYNIWSNTQGNRFNRLASISGLGQTATNNLNSASSNYGANAGNIIANTGNQNADLLTQAGNARASQFAANGNIFGNPGQSLADIYALSQLRRN